MIELILASIPVVPSVGPLEKIEQKESKNLVYLVMATIPEEPVARVTGEPEKIIPNRNAVQCVQAAIPSVVSVL